MNLKSWLKAGRGRHAALAAHLGLSRGRITQIADRGVPIKYLIAVRGFTKGAVTLEEMAAQRAIPAKARHQNGR